MSLGKKFLRSFIFAGEGIFYALKTQRNLRIHFFIAFLILSLRSFLQFEVNEMLFLLFAITLVITAEMINTAIEAIVDLEVQTYHPLARAAKNVSAGAVLIVALSSIAVAYLVLFPRFKLFLISSDIGKIKESLFAFIIVAFLAAGLVLLAAGTFSRWFSWLPEHVLCPRSTLAFAFASALSLYTSDWLVSSFSFFLALTAAYNSLEDEKHRLSAVLIGVTIGIFVTALLFKLKI